MTPSLSIPTDNIYKFCCLFGLAMTIAATASFVSLFHQKLESQIENVEFIIALESNASRSPAEQRLLDFRKSNLIAAYAPDDISNIAQAMLVSLFVFGLGLSAVGAYKWKINIQVRDDRIAHLQIRKLEVEIEKLNMDIQILSGGSVKPSLVADASEGTRLPRGRSTT